ncbi:ELKS/Rab6-interacting/CAST family protein [Nodularia sphaerocarpa]|uniref:ELKS/Rab6-interacting/CAST family protein n=1 Tax=Nodularia sphaerocarpa TaxID=137816 RepID=UPI001EFB67FC|nr:ELKS/Rab6-interacting/CAST family protein [Nodularia sphaerocarpa]MDB9373375.1 hypothetical protein [Nodularia sphaerocarpa CS-585]MDB9379680.1 hypothetical protein [Nodularia sphaerocarpa CS-585A2]ULP74080.1 hypothetical protein BDGGKGIB_03740 [Nodularia sphaerocarpa UHCC 0038]
MQTTPNSVNGNSGKPPNSQPQPTSVPLYVYRELATELQSTQAKLDTVTNQNHQLEQENQLLRQEITKVIQSCSHLQKFVDSPPQPSHPQATHAAGEVKSPATAATAASQPQKVSRQRPPVVKEKSHDTDFSAPVEINQIIPETFFIEEQEVNYYSPTEKKVNEFSGWWLAVTILLIMLTAFGAGYLIVRPLFENPNR